MMGTKIVIGIGQKFRRDKYEVYILAQVESHRVCLISLTDGNRWVEPQYIDDIRSLTSEEWARVTNDKKGKPKFRRVLK